jgi:hypothetical protein
VRLYSNLHQDLFNKEHKQKEERGMRGGGGLTFCKNYKITIRIFGRKNQEKIRKKARTGRRNVWRYRPCSTLNLGLTPLKGEGDKTVTHLSNARCPLLIKGDAQ